jgi:DNA-binding MarR family transcriptional regulator
MTDIYTLKTMDLRDSLGPLIAQTRNALHHAVDQEFQRDAEVAPLDVTSAQFAIIAHILKQDVKSACELCDRLEYDRGAMSRMIDRLQKKNLIQRVPLAHTRRGVALEVTAAGQAAFPKMEACVVRVVNRMLKGVTKKQVSDTEEVLRTMLANSASL